MEFSQIVSQSQFCKFTPNSEYFLYLEGKKIYIKQCSVKLSNFSVINLNLSPNQIVVSPNSELIGVLFKQKSLVMVYDLKGSLVAKMEDNQSGYSGIIWSPDSYQLIIFSDMLYKCSVYNLVDKSISYIRSPKLSNSKGCVFSSNGKLMALLERHDCKDTLGIYYTGSWKLVNSILLTQSFDIVEIKWASNDSSIVAWENAINYKLYAICPYKGVIFKFQPYDYALGIKAVQFSPRCHFVAIGSYDQKIRLLNALTWKLIVQLDLSNTSITTDYTKIYKEDDSQKNNNRMKLVDRNTYKIPTSKPIISEKGSPAQGVGLLEFSSDDSYVACRNDNMPYTVWIWNMSKLEVEAIISLNSHVKMIKWDKFENTLCVVSGVDKILFWKNGLILECAFPLQNRKFNIQRFLWSSDNKKMLLFDKNEFIYADLVSND